MVRTKRAAVKDQAGSSSCPKQVRVVGDPKLGIKQRSLVHQIDGSTVIRYRPLNIDNSLIFDLKTDDPLLFLDMKSLRLDYNGKLGELDADGEVDDLRLEPEVEEKMAAVRKVVQTIETSDATDKDGKRIIRLKEKAASVQYTTEVFKGTLLAPGPMFGLTQFRNVAVSIGGMRLENHARELLPWQVYMRALLELKPETMNAHMRWALFVLDTTPFNTPGSSPSNATNKGLSERFAMAGNSKPWRFNVPLWLDALDGFHQTSLLPGNCPLRLAFEKSDPKICMTANTENKRFGQKMDNCEIRARYYRLTPEAYEEFMRELRVRELQLNYTSHAMDYRYIQKDNNQYRLKLPKEKGVNMDKFYMTLLSTDQFRGTYGSNSFWFRPHDLKSIQIDYSDGRGRLELAASFETDKFSDMYLFFLEQNGVGVYDEPMANVPPDLFKDGRFGFCLDLTRNKASRGDDGEEKPITVPTTNDIEITLEFKTTLVDQLVLIFMAYREQSLFLHSDMRVRLCD